MNWSEVKLIIFDCDGTLVDTETLTARLMTDMINDLGISISLEECTARFIGTKFSDIADYVRSKGITIDPLEFENDYRYRCKDLFERELQPIPGVKSLLKNLKPSYCIASNGPKEKMKITLKASGLNPFFSPSHIFSAYDNKIWKPEPDLFLTAARAMKYAPEECLVVEDTIHGVEAAIAANMEVVGINIKHQEEDIKGLGIKTFPDIRALSGEMDNAGLFL